VLQILGIVLPLFAIIALGKAAIRWNFMDSSGSAILSRFTFYVPIPALLFGLMAELQISLGVSGAYFTGCLLIYAVALWVGRWLADSSLAHRAVFALDTTFGNVTFLGVPLILSFWGKDGLGHLVGIIVVTTTLIPLSVILMEISHKRRAGSTTTARGTILGLIKNPVINSMILGFLWRVTGIPIPAPLHNFLDILARAAPPLALFCLGASLPAMSWEVVREGLSGTLLKLVIMPLLVATLCYATGFSGLALTVAVLTAGLPTGANAFLIARGTTTYGESSATTVVMATMMSVITLPILLYFLQ
jgi:malonate transporter and related proteins